MITILTCILFSLVAAFSASLRPVYSAIPIKELKRRAAHGDQMAHILYQVAHHGFTADALLSAATLLSSAIVVIILSSISSSLIGILLIIIFLWLVFFVLPGRETKWAKRAALPISPYLARLLIKIRPLTNRLARLVRKHRPVTVKTGVFTKRDILQLFEDQKISATNQIEVSELEVAMHALTFGDKKVHEVMTPRRSVHFVEAEEPIGPVLLSELHDSGFSRFPVRKETDNVIVGTLYLRDLVDRKNGGIVSNAMSSKVFYVKDNESLEHVLHAFLKTKHHLFIVVNEFEDVVGIITIEDVLEQILGRKIVDEFDRYDDMRLVAAKEVASSDKPMV